MMRPPTPPILQPKHLETDNPKETAKSAETSKQIDESSTPLEQLRARLNRRTFVTVPDGRIFSGFFVCIDRDCNLVLSAAEEFSAEQPKGKGRFIGNVLITKNNIVRAEMEAFPTQRPILIPTLDF